MAQSGCAKQYFMFTFNLLQIMLKPVEYGLTSSQITYKAEKNLKVVASLFVYLLRKIYAKDKKVVPVFISRP